MTDRVQNLQNVSNIFTIFILMLIAIGFFIFIISGFFLFSPISIESSSIFHNGSIEGNTSVQIITPLFFHKFSMEENTSFVINKINQFFSLSSISIIYKSYFSNGGLLYLIINNFAIFLAIIGAFSLYCYFYFNITFNANVISEYPESQQQNLKIFLQILYLIFIVFAIYAISMILFNLPIKPVEKILLLVFFILEVLTSAIFYDYLKKIRPSYDNMVQFAAFRDSKKFSDTLIYFISIFGFIFPFLVVLYGIIADFNILSIIFTISFVLIMVWQLNIINNEPRSIFNLKVKGHAKICQGFLLTMVDKETIQVLCKNDKIIQIPRTSIEYFTLNRTIRKTEIVNPPKNFYHAILTVWDSLEILKNILKTLLGFVLGILGGLVIFLGVAILNTNFGFPPQWLIVIFFSLVLIFGFVFGRSYQKKFSNK